MQSSCFSAPLLGHQRGVSTLIFAVIILALTAIAALTTFNFVRQEQVISNNDARAKQAFEAAEAGLAVALDYLGDGPDRDDDGVIDPVFYANDDDDIGDTNEADIGPGHVVVTTGPLGKQVAVTATGFSDDRTAKHVISQLSGVVDPLSNDPANPFIAKGAVELNGSATVHNPEGHSTIWSGSKVGLGSNNSTATTVADMGGENYPQCMDTPMTCGTVSSSNMLSVGLDVIENDSSLGNLTSDELFRNFFGMSPKAFRDSGLVSLETTPASVNEDVQLATHEVIWVEGGGAITELSNVTVGCADAVKGKKTCKSSDSKPSILIVNGDASFKGTPNFTGLVFVTGNASISKGNTTVMGSIVVAGEFSSDTGGSMDVWYNSDVLGDLENAGFRVGVAGTWKDF